MDAVVSRVLPTVFLLAACSPGAPGAEGDGAPVAEEEPQHELHLESQQIQDWGIRIGAIGRTTIAAELTLPGALTLNENRTAIIAPLVEGQISSVRVDVGSRVGRGQVLATMNSPEFTRAQTQFLQAYAQAELSRTDFERAQSLRETRAIEEREFLRRQAVYEQALAERRAAEVVLHSLGLDEDRMRELERAVAVSVAPEDHGAVDPPLPIQTPIGGVVIQRHAVLGEHAEPGHTLFTVSDISSLWARLDAYEDQMAYLDPTAEIVITTTVFPDREFPGKITFIADQIDEQLRTVRVRAEIPNLDGALRPNMYVQGFMRIQSDEERLVVPVDAVQLLEGHHVVFVLMPEIPGESHIVIRAVDVEPGETLSIGRVVESGLSGQETIVTVGAFSLKAELTKGAGGHGHVH
jgi:cobalt-zinc-cadmium efflux system membrane fusion protein